MHAACTKHAHRMHTPPEDPGRVNGVNRAEPQSQAGVVENAGEAPGPGGVRLRRPGPMARRSGLGASPKRLTRAASFPAPALWKCRAWAGARRLLAATQSRHRRVPASLPAKAGYAGVTGEAGDLSRLSAARVSFHAPSRASRGVPREPRGRLRSCRSTRRPPPSRHAALRCSRPAVPRACVAPISSPASSSGDLR